MRIVKRIIGVAVSDECDRCGGPLSNTYPLQHCVSKTCPSSPFGWKFKLAMTNMSRFMTWVYLEARLNGSWWPIPHGEKLRRTLLVSEAIQKGVLLLSWPREKT